MMARVVMGAQTITWEVRRGCVRTVQTAPCSCDRVRTVNTRGVSEVLIGRRVVLYHVSSCLACLVCVQLAMIASLVIAVYSMPDITTAIIARTRDWGSWTR